MQEDSLSKERRDRAGLSLDEVKSIAEEVGIDPSFIGLAAQKSNKKKDLDVEQGFLGQSKKLTLYREIEGELDKSKIEEIVDHFRASTGQRGILERVDDKFEWKSSPISKPEYLLKGETHEGITDIKLEFRPNKGHNVGELIPTFIPMVFPLLALFSGAPFGVIIPFFLFATLMTVMGFTSTKKSFEKKEERSLQKVERLLSISESIVQRGSSLSKETDEKRIDTDLLGLEKPERSESRPIERRMERGNG